MIRTMQAGRALFGRFSKPYETQTGPADYIGRHRAIELPASRQSIAVPAARPAGTEQVSGTAVIA